MNKHRKTVGNVAPTRESFGMLRQLSVGATLFLALIFTCSQAWASGDPVAGQKKAATCAACHGETGVSTIDTNPVLAGQYESYLVYALQSYRDGSRQNAIMAGFVATLSDQDIADLAAWFSSQKGPLQTAPVK
ncbi:MAG: cytochrome c [Granulosicoccus sp.]